MAAGFAMTADFLFYDRTSQTVQRPCTYAVATAGANDKPAV
jgi:hypothetical protein